MADTSDMPHYVRAIDYARACREAIEATARELGPDVDPAALAEAARDGRLFAFSLEHEMQTYPDGICATAIADIRAGKGGE